MLAALPPAGDPVALRPRAARTFDELAAPAQVRYYGSGTAALAAALAAAVRVRGCRSPEVVVPAYGCPSIVSAVLHAGAQPVPVDLEPERPWLSLTALERALGEQTVAVVGVHLLGIPERVEALARRARAVGAFLVLDSAQAFGEPLLPAEADVAIYSFGRGKPISLLGGGALIARESELLSRVPIPETTPNPGGAATRAGLYNVLRRPAWYGVLSRMPGLGLGETRFEPLREIQGMDAWRRSVLAENLRVYRRRPDRVERWLDAALSDLESGLVEDLSRACAASGRVLRYPLLFASKALRDYAKWELVRCGLGASAMYELPLPEIPGVAPHLRRCGAYPNATAFAERLMTLPTHSGVRREHVAKIRAVLGKMIDAPTSYHAIPQFREESR